MEISLCVAPRRARAAWRLSCWWEAVIVRVDEGEFLVRWRDEPNEPRVGRSHEYFTLNSPALNSSG